MNLERQIREELNNRKDLVKERLHNHDRIGPSLAERDRVDRLVPNVGMEILSHDCLFVQENQIGHDKDLEMKSATFGFIKKSTNSLKSTFISTYGRRKIVQDELLEIQSSQQFALDLFREAAPLGILPFANYCVGQNVALSMARMLGVQNFCLPA